jgi:hypothetical protein
LTDRYRGNLLLARRGTHAAENAGNTAHPYHQRGDRRLFAGLASQEMHGVDRSLLPEALDSSDALLESDRRPGQLEVDHQPASMVKIQSFAGGVCRQQYSHVAADKTAQNVLPLGAGHTSVKLQRCKVVEVLGQTMECVAVLGEDDGRLASAPEKTAKCPELGLGLLRQTSQSKHVLEPSSLLMTIRQSGRAQLGRRYVIVCSRIGKRERHLQQIWLVVDA